MWCMGDDSLSVEEFDCLKGCKQNKDERHQNELEMRFQKTGSKQPTLDHHSGHMTMNMNTAALCVKRTAYF